MSAQIFGNITAALIGGGGAILLSQYIGVGKCKSEAGLEGKTFVITGSNSGIGLEAARDLSKRGARVVMACRNIESANQEAKKIESETGNPLVVYNLDLASLKSIRDCAREIVKNEKRIDVLINNAGVALCPHTRTEDGFEMQMGTNHLGHFLLTNLLLDKLVESQPSRIVTVSSRAHARIKGLELDDLNYEQRPYNGGAAYGESKLANVLFSRELGKRLSQDESTQHVTTYSLHPGLVRTEIFRHIEQWLGPVKFLVRGMALLFTKSPTQGAQTTIYCAVDETLGNETGQYYVDCARSKTSPAGEDDEVAAKLWKISEKLVGL